MYAWRTTWKAKPGRLQDAVALLNDDTGRPPTTNATMRAYTTQVSEGELLVFEEVWPSIKAHDQWWAEWRKAPRMTRVGLNGIKWSSCSSPPSTGK